MVRILQRRFRRGIARDWARLALSLLVGRIGRVHRVPQRCGLHLLEQTTDLLHDFVQLGQSSRGGSWHGDVPLELGDALLRDLDLLVFFAGCLLGCQECLPGCLDLHVGGLGSLDRPGEILLGGLQLNSLGLLLALDLLVGGLELRLELALEVWVPPCLASGLRGCLDHSLAILQGLLGFPRVQVRAVRRRRTCCGGVSWCAVVAAAAAAAALLCRTWRGFRRMVVASTPACATFPPVVPLADAAFPLPAPGRGRRLVHSLLLQCHANRIHKCLVGPRLATLDRLPFTHAAV